MRFAQDDFRVSTASQMVLALDGKYSILSDVDGTMTRSPLSAVHLIAYLGDAHAMSDLLNQGFDVHTLDTNRRSPLWWAASQGHAAVVDLLLSQKNVSVNSRGFWQDTTGDQYLTETSLGVAAVIGKAKIVERLLEREDVDVNLPDEGGRSPLSSAACQGHSAIVRLLLTRKDIDVNSRDILGRTPLWRAVERGREDVVRQLLRTKNTQVNCVNDSGRSPLSWAVYEGHEGIVKLLLRYADIDVNAEDRFGRTALHIAAQEGYPAIVKLLSDHPDVDLNPTDNEGRDVFAGVSEWQEWYSEEQDWQRMEGMDECLEILRAAIEEHSLDRSRVMQEEEP